MAKKLTKAKAREILHDKEVHGHPLTDKQRRFFGAISGGAKPYKAQFGGIGGLLTGFHPNLKETASEVLSAPQKAATQLVTGKYQTPSEALGIQNAAGAFLTDVVLDPLGLLGIGAAKKMGALDNVYKINPWRFKPDPEAGYRMIGGKEGYLDAITSGEIRPTAQYKHAHFNIGQPLNPNRLSAEELLKAGSPGGYKGPYMAEMKQGTWQRMSDAFPNNPEMQEQFRLLGKDKDVWQHPLFGNIKVDDPRLKLYKEDWLRGYKEVKPPKKKQDGGAVEGRMAGLTDKGFNFNPAWGGAWREGGDLPKSQKGKNVCPPGFVNIEGKCYDRSSDEYKDLYREGIGYLDETGTLVSSRMELPEVVVKPESVLNFLDKAIGPFGGGAARYAFDQLGKKYGFPEVQSQKEYKKNNPISLFSLPKARGHYWDNTIYADDVPTYLSELAHHTMFKDKGRVNQIRNWIGNDMIEYVTGNNPYKKEGTIEYEAHKIVEPKLREEYIKHKKKYFFDTYGLNENVGIGVYKNGGWLDKYADGGNLQPPMSGAMQPAFSQQFAMGGSIPGAVGFTYARVAGAAPSEGPYAKKTLPSAQNGAEMSFYQQGLDWTPRNISRNGGWLDKFEEGGEIVKDNEGYWNPDNWGKPVEISSNKITMEGVLEPLLGVSDTGDTKMMYPGKNYTFDGTKVVEYPREHFRAEHGKSVNRADEYPLEKLDNLLNFTNYNKPKAKNGWLEKYK